MNKENKDVETTFLARERNALSEERTILAYIRTELTFLGIVVVILKFYFETILWTVYLAVALFVIVGIIVFIETIKIKKLRIQRRKLQKKHKYLEDFD